MVIYVAMLTYCLLKSATTVGRRILTRASTTSSLGRTGGVAGLTAAANAVVNAVNLEYNDWSGDAAAKTEKDPNSRYKHLKYVESSVVIHCYVYRRRFFDLSFITS